MNAAANSRHSDSQADVCSWPAAAVFLQPSVASDAGPITLPHPTPQPQAPASPAPATPSDTIVDFAERIRELWARGRGNTIEVAVELERARHTLPHGGWTALFRSSPRLPVSHRQADRLLGIARLAWLNETGRSRLPRSWSSLELLARLDRPILDHLIAEGTVHPNLSVREAGDLVARFRGEKHRVGTESPAVRRRVQRFCQFVLDGWDTWSPEQRRLTQDELLQLVHRLDARNGFATPQT